MPRRCFRLKTVDMERGRKPKTQNQRPFSAKKSGRLAASLDRFCRSFDDYHTFFLVKLLQHHFYDFAFLRWNEFTYEIRLNRQFAVLFSAIDQDCELNAT